MLRFHRIQRVLLGLLLVSGGAVAAELEPKALAALEQMGSYLRGLQQLRIDADSRTDQVLENGQVIEFNHQTHLLARRPDKLRLQVERDGNRRSLFYNGQRFTLYDSRSGYFTEQVAPTDIASLLAQLSERYGIELPLADLFRWDANTAKVAGLNDALWIDQQTLDGQVCDHYAFRQPDIDWQLWIRQGPQPLPCRLVISRRDSAELPRHSVDYRWQLDAPSNDRDFEFTPPTGARAIPLAPAGAQP